MVREVVHDVLFLGQKSESFFFKQKTAYKIGQ